MELQILVLLLVLLAAWAGGSVASRLGYPAVLGELVIGILIGPAVLGLLGQGSLLSEWTGTDGGYEALTVLAEAGVLLLMLYIGMEIDPRELGKASWAGFLAAIGGFIAPFLMGWGVVLLFADSLPEGMNPHVTGMFVGIAAGVTSLVTKSRILMDLKILDTRIAHVMLAGALIADTMSLLVFAGVLGFAESETLEVMVLVKVGARAVLFFGISALVGLYVLPFVFKQFQRLGIKNRGIYFTLMLVVALAFGEGAHLAGLHAILGTFVAGLFLQEGMLEPKLNRELNDLLRDVSVGFLAPIFFVTSGFAVSFEVFQTDLLLFIAIMLVAFVGKIVGTTLFYLPTGFGWREGVVLGGGMNGRGAVEIILAGIGLSMGLISKEIFSILVFMAIITTATVPFFLKWGTDWLKRLNLLVRSADKRNTALIIGATPLARVMAKLIAEVQPVHLIDSNPLRVDEAKREGLSAVAGNALDTELLARAHAPASGLALAMTGNAEINALAARQLRDVFLVRNLHVLVLGKNRSADTQTFEHLDASMLFAQAVALSDWDHWFSRGQAELERVPVPGMNAREIVRALNGGPPCLPLAIEREHEGRRKIIPMHSGLECAAGDTLVVARASVAAAPSSDRFDELVRTCPVLDIEGALDREQFFGQASDAMANILSESAQELRDALHEREASSSTMLTPGLAVPHIILRGTGRFGLLVARCRGGVGMATNETAHALFVMAATPDERNFHLKALSAVAQIWQSSDFEARWLEAKSQDDLRELLLNAPRQRTA